MGAKSRTVFRCRGCGHEESKWLGRCPACGSWNSFAEAEAAKAGGSRTAAGAGASAGPGPAARPLPLNAVETREDIRLDSGMAEMNRVLGGGIMRGASVLVGGEPGIGKSTLMLQAAARLRSPGRVLYVAGEESPAQIRLRADRLGIQGDRIEILAETELGTVMQAAETLKPVLLIADSLQTLYTRETDSHPGSVTQIRLCTQELTEWARTRGTALFLVAHVTKEGAIAGPKIVEHMVDTVLSFEQAGTEIRMLQAVKNRFGSVDEVGLFRMGEEGLTEVGNPASVFLVPRDGTPPAGTAVAPVIEGSRVLLVEIQSLVIPAKGGVSRIFSDRIDAGRVARVAAVLEKHAGLRFSDLDLYVNVAGGLRVAEVGVELPLALALYSARMDIPLPPRLAVAGEVSLAGEIMKIQGLDKRLRASRDLGYARLIGPAAGGAAAAGGLDPVSTVAQAVKAAFAP